jgi:hypothetical protein
MANSLVCRCKHTALYLAEPKLLKEFDPDEKATDAEPQ